MKYEKLLFVDKEKKGRLFKLYLPNIHKDGEDNASFATTIDTTSGPMSIATIYQTTLKTSPILKNMGERPKLKDVIPYSLFTSEGFAQTIEI